MSRDGVYVNLYHNSELDWHLEDGAGLKLTQTTNYPWTGDIKLSVDPARASDFTVYLRWPAWAASADVQVNGQPVQSPDIKRGSFIPISRNWNPGDTITVSLPLANRSDCCQSAVCGPLWSCCHATRAACLYT